MVIPVLSLVEKRNFFHFKFINDITFLACNYHKNEEGKYVIKRLLITWVIMGALVMNTASANDEHVQHDISLLQDMMEHMLVVIERVEQRQDRIAPNATYYFDTELLRRDLSRISLGIDDYLSPMRTPARFIKRIDGDYLIQR